MDQDLKLSKNGRETPSKELVVVERCSTPLVSTPPLVSTEVLLAMKDFVDDLSSVVFTSNFEMYRSIINRIDESKVNAYAKMIHGVKQFFLENEMQLKSGLFEKLPNPYLSYVSENGIFSFNIETALQSITEHEQEVVKDHLNHIWSLINREDKSVEEVYIDNVFKNVDSKFSSNMSKEKQIEIAKDLFADFQKQDMDINVVVKYACKKARRLLEKNGCEEASPTMILIDEVEKIDINNFNMIQLLGVVGKVGTMFSQGDENPMKYLLPGIFTAGQDVPTIEGLTTPPPT